ncbi:MAG: hypothetical protein ACM31G_07190 [Flavobacteriales bacterium]
MTPKQIKLTLLGVYTAIYAVILLIGNFTIRESILLYLAGFGLIILLDPLIKIYNVWRAKKSAKEQERINKYIKIAKKRGSSCFQVGPKKQYTVWAKDIIHANKIFRDLILPQSVLKPKKAYYYITRECNNLNS